METETFRSTISKKRVTTYFVHQMLLALMSIILITGCVIISLHFLLIPISTAVFLIDAVLIIAAGVVFGIWIFYKYLTVISAAAQNNYFVEVEKDEVLVTLGKEVISFQADHVVDYQPFLDWWSYYLSGPIPSGFQFIKKLSRHGTYMAHPCADPEQLIVLKLQKPLGKSVNPLWGSIEARTSVVINISDVDRFTGTIGLRGSNPPWKRLPARFYGSCNPVNLIRYKVARYISIVAALLVVAAALTLPAALGSCVVCPALILLWIPITSLMIVILSIPLIVTLVQRGGMDPGPPPFVEVSHTGLGLSNKGMTAKVPFSDIEKVQMFEDAWEDARGKSAPGWLRYPRKVKGFALPLHDTKGADMERLFVIHLHRESPMYDSAKKGARPHRRVVVDIDHWGQFYRTMVEVGQGKIVELRDDTYDPDGNRTKVYTPIKRKVRKLKKVKKKAPEKKPEPKPEPKPAPAPTAQAKVKFPMGRTPADISRTVAKAKQTRLSVMKEKESVEVK